MADNFLALVINVATYLTTVKDDMNSHDNEFPIHLL